MIKTLAHTEESVFSSYMTSIFSKHEEEVIEISTLDGGFINYNAGYNAVNKGTGVIIGDYFVGVSDTYHIYNETLYVRY